MPIVEQKNMQMGEGQVDDLGIKDAARKQTYWKMGCSSQKDV